MALAQSAINAMCKQMKEFIKNKSHRNLKKLTVFLEKYDSSIKEISMAEI
jgi:hypothetical protein